MKTYKELYAKAIKKGKLRADENVIADFIDDTNELGRIIWTQIFQNINGNVPKATRTENLNIATTGDYTHTRVITKTPILKISFGDCTIVPKKTDKVCQTGCFSYSYDDEEIIFSDALVGDYVIYYEVPVYTELTLTMYNADEEPEWLKDDFVPIFWIYYAMLNTETKQNELSELYKYYKNLIDDYYDRTDDYEDVILTRE